MFSFAKYLIVFCSILISFNSFAVIRFKVDIIHKKGPDEELILTSELHSIEDIIGQETVKLQLKDGISMTFSAMFSNKIYSYGPPSKVLVKVIIFDEDENILQRIPADESILSLNESRSFIYNFKSEQIIITLKPEVR